MHQWDFIPLAVWCAEGLIIGGAWAAGAWHQHTANARREEALQKMRKLRLYQGGAYDV